MNILKLEFKNFNSYGSDWTTIDFEKNSEKGYLNLVQGSNGSGKSSLSGTLSFALYGKVEGKTKTSLPNRINKELEVKILLRSKNKLISIHRGVSPTFLSILVDGKPIKDANSNMDKFQTYLEEELYEIPYLVFKNVLVLSINDFKSFLTMSPGDRRAIADKLFGFSILNSIKDSVKEEKRSIKELLFKQNNESELTEKSILSLESRLEVLKNLNQDALKNKISELKENIENKKIEFKEYNSLNLEDYKQFKNSEKLSMSNLENLKVEFKSIEKSLQLYLSDKCPTCGGNLKDEIHISEKNKLLLEKTRIESDLKLKLSDLKEIKLKITEFEKLIEIENKAKNQIKLEISNFEKVLKETQLKLNSSIESNSQVEISNLIKSNKDRLLELSKEFDLVNEDESFLTIFEDLIGDNGLKATIMKSILPQLNLQILKFLKELHLQYRIEFDETFSIKLTHLDEEISPTTMSTGERKIADFICILSILQILKTKFPSINLLFLDEIFSSIDANGIYEITKLLNKIANEDNIHTFVINHSTLPAEFFNHQLEITKENGFSKITYLEN